MLERAILMPKRPNRRVPPESQMIPPERNRVLEDWGKDIVRRDIEDAAREECAADRLPERESYPTNNFALTALVLGALIIVIALAYVTGMVK
jgi:hypothetical protein